jgi:hypothetical protein
LWGGLPVGTKRTRSNLNMRAAARAACTCPVWIGSKVPPNKAIFTLLEPRQKIR